LTVCFSQVVTVETNAQNAKVLVDLGIQSTDISSSFNAENSITQLLKLTSGNGFDVVLTDKDMDFPETLLAPLGRFIGLGSGVISSGAKKNISITSVDFKSLVLTKPSIVTEYVLLDARSFVPFSIQYRQVF
jgi:NADPH:quinone reductase-like Zn-dependent oxidoreductase